MSRKSLTNLDNPLDLIRAMTIHSPLCKRGARGDLSVARHRSGKEPDIGIFVMKVFDAIAGGSIGSSARRGVG